MVADTITHLPNKTVGIDLKRMAHYYSYGFESTTPQALSSGFQSVNRENVFHTCAGSTVLLRRVATLWKWVRSGRGFKYNHFGWGGGDFDTYNL